MTNINGGDIVENKITKYAPYYTRANRNTFLGLTAAGFSVMLTAIIMPMIVVRFGSDNWGRDSFFLLYVAILTFIESSLQVYVSQCIATALSTASNYFWRRDTKIWVAIGGAFAGAGLIINFGITNGVAQDVNLKYMLWLALVNVFPRAISSVIKGGMQGLSNQARYYSVTTLFNLSRPLYLLLMLMLFKLQILLLVVAYVIFSFVEMTAYLLLDTPLRSTQPEAIKSNAVDLKLLPSLLIANCLSVVAANLDKILIFISVNLTLASTYTFAASVAGLLYLYVNVAIASFGPKFKELFLNNEKAAMRQYFYKISFINNTLVMLGIAAFYFTGSGLLQPLASKLDVQNVINTFLYLAAASLLSSNLWIPGIISTSVQIPSFNVKTNVIFIAVYLLSFYKIFPESDQFIFAKSMLVASAVTTTIGMGYFKIKVFDVSMMRYVLLSVALPMLFVGFLMLPLWWIDECFKLFWMNTAYLCFIGVVHIGIWFWIGDKLKKYFITLVGI